MHHFRLYSTIYWEHAFAMGKNAADLSAVQRNVVTDVRILMHEMARSIDPVATAKMHCTLQFDFPDKDIHFCVDIDHGTCTLTEATADSPALRVTTSTETWAQLFLREIDVRAALMKHEITLAGDKSLFSKLDRFFPPPSQ
jgi:putative sterol carrier protein